MSDNRQFDHRSAGTDGIDAWKGLMIGTRQADLASRRASFTALKEMQMKMQEKAADLAAANREDLAEGVLAQSDEFGRMAETTVPTQVDAQGNRKMSGGLQGTIWDKNDPKAKRKILNANYMSELDNQQAKGFTTPITEANQKVVAQIDQMLQVPQTSYTFNNKQYTAQQLQDLKNDFPTDSIQDLYNREKQSYLESMVEDPATKQQIKRSELPMKRAQAQADEWYVGQLTSLNQEAAQLASKNKWDDTKKNAYLQQRTNELGDMYGNIYTNYQRINERQAVQEANQYLQDNFINDKMVRWFGEDLWKATQGGAYRNNLNPTN